MAKNNSNHKRSNEKLSSEDKVKKVKESETEVEVAIPVGGDDLEGSLDPFELANYYLASAIETLDEDEAKAIDLFKVTVNESNQLLHQHYETQPEKFSASFYLPLVISLYYLGIMDCETDQLKGEFFKTSLEKLKVGLTKLDPEVEGGLVLQLEYGLVELKLKFQIFSLHMKLVEENAAQEEGELKQKFEEVQTHFQNYFELVNSSSDEVLAAGKFSDFQLEPIETLNSLVELVASFNNPKLSYTWLKNILGSYDSITKAGEITVLGMKGKASNLVQLANLYFDYGEDEDTDSEQDEDDEEEDGHLAKLEITREEAETYLLSAVETAKTGLQSTQSLNMDNPYFQAQLHIILGEAYLNLGNLTQVDTKESEFYTQAVESFELAKQLDSNLELPETFETFLQGFKLELQK